MQNSQNAVSNEQNCLVHIHVYVHCIIVGTTYANYRIFVSGNEKEISMIFCLVCVG